MEWYAYLTFNNPKVEHRIANLRDDLLLSQEFEVIILKVVVDAITSPLLFSFVAHLSTYKH